MSVIYNKIKQLRKEHHISQQELASYLKIERTSLSKIENMHYPMYSALIPLLQ